MINKFNQLLICFFFCFSCISFRLSSQNIDSKETIFILFDNSNFETKRIENAKEEMFLANYFFSIYDNTQASNPTGIIQLSYRKYEDYDHKIANIPVPIFQVNKRFLNNNKDLVFSLKDFEEIGYKKTTVLLLNAKHIFLIDKTEADNKNIIIKEVFLIYNHEQ